jgi:hypothetical protein
MFQVEFLSHESSKTTNENIINLIDREYIEGSSLFNKKFMQRSFYLFIIGNF